MITSRRKNWAKQPLLLLPQSRIRSRRVQPLTGPCALGRDLKVANLGEGSVLAILTGRLRWPGSGHVRWPPCGRLHWPSQTAGTRIARCRRKTEPALFKDDGGYNGCALSHSVWVA